MDTINAPKERIFTRYQVFVIAILALLQFTVILDFMVLNPLSEILMRKWDISAAQFGLVVSGYAFSAGISGVLAAGFADKFDRKKMLLLFYTGFILGTYLCALAPNYQMLLAARIVTGLFGGVISAIGMAIVADLFMPETRGRVMGFIQMAFALSQIVGIPVGWELAIRFEWHAPFWMIGVLGTLMGILIAVYMRPITEHLTKRTEKNAFKHLWDTLRNRRYFLAFGTMVLMATGGYMLMPFGNAFSIHNMGIHPEQITFLFMAVGLANLVSAPFIGRFTDKLGRVNVFYAASLLTLVMVVILTHRGITPLWLAIIINSIMMIGVFGRMIPVNAIMTSMPSMQDRGAFMSINASIQQLAGGLASVLAGQIIHKTGTGYLEHYDTLGFVIVGALIITTIMITLLNRQISAEKTSAAVTPPENVAAAH
ncbi:MFS transporter [Chitinophaga sp. 22620]|uniref:MFS transporter n=1 Tax=Chitinophaga sp. 22620 TaxID=3453952 RepID=UPI003F83C311